MNTSLDHILGSVLIIGGYLEAVIDIFPSGVIIPGYRRSTLITKVFYPSSSILKCMFNIVLTAAFALGLIVVAFLSWLVASVAIWIASDAISRKISFSRAMFVSLASVIVFLVLEFLFGLISPILGVIFGLLGVLYVIKTELHTGWVKAFVIAVIALIVFLILEIILSALVGITLLIPTSFH